VCEGKKPAGMGSREAFSTSGYFCTLVGAYLGGEVRLVSGRAGATKCAYTRLLKVLMRESWT